VPCLSSNDPQIALMQNFFVAKPDEKLAKNPSPEQHLQVPLHPLYCPAGTLLIMLGSSLTSPLITRMSIAEVMLTLKMGPKNAIQPVVAYLLSRPANDKSSMSRIGSKGRRSATNNCWHWRKPLTTWRN